jgi:hypothetical protein
VSRIEESLLRRAPGSRILAWSAAAGLAGVAPLLLYIVFGPPKGNPIGLGLLAVVTVPVAGIGMMVGLIKMLVERFGSRR